MTAEFLISSARTSDDVAAVKQLFMTYEASLEVDLQYQNFAAELAALPGPYAPPEGELLLARDHAGTPIGCVGMRRLKGDICEMKRLYVTPSGRGSGLGRALVRIIIEAAARSGYAKMVLDTLPSMHSAQSLYLVEGFLPIEPYYDTPIAGTMFMELCLKPGGSP